MTPARDVKDTSPAPAAAVTSRVSSSPKVDTFANGVTSSALPADKYAATLPDFSQSNAAVLKRHPYCANTRMHALTAVDTWLKDGSVDKSRVMLLKADAGMGKTTLMGEICSKFRPQIVGYHFFSYNSANMNHNDLKLALLWLVRSFTRTIDTYEASLPSERDLEQLLVCSPSTADDVINELIRTRCFRLLR